MVQVTKSNFLEVRQTIDYRKNHYCYSVLFFVVVVDE
jgi:hypothetical protein